MNKLDRFKNLFTGRFSAKDQTFFAKRLSFLVHGGVPILESLHILSRQAKSKGKKKIFEKIIDDVANGQFLSTSLAQFRGSFGDFAINLIRVGETSGILGQNLNYLADELKKKQILRQKVLGALVYPLFITIATLGITVLLTAYIFPKIMPIFQSLHVKLPLATRMLISVSNFIRSYGFYLGGGIAAAIIIFFVLLMKVRQFRFAFDRTLITLPFAGKLVQSYNMTNICRTLGLLLKSGINVSDAASITAKTVTNLVYKNEIEATHENVLKGERISVRLEKNPRLFPDMLSHMVSIGETSGNLPDTLIYLSEMYENDVDDLTKSLSSSIEPILMIVMGIIVGFVAVSVITPIYEITQNLTPK